MKYRYCNRKNDANTLLSVICSDGRLYISTGIRKLSGEFDSETGYSYTDDIYTTANYKLMEFRLSVKEKYTQLFSEIGAPPTKSELKELVTGKGSKKSQSYTLLEVLCSYKEACQTKQIISHGKPLKESTKRNKIAQINSIIKACSDKELSFVVTKRYHRRDNGVAAYQGLGEDIISQLLNSEYDSSTIHTLINTLKSILRWHMTRHSASNIEFIQRIEFQNIRYDVEVLTSEDTEYIISQEKKIRMMLSPRQSNAMDYLIVALFIAPRVGDMKKWDSSNLYEKDGKNWLTYSQEKTGVKIDVPINSLVHTIFSRNLISCQRLLPLCPTNLNKSISTICSLVPSMQEQGSKTRIRGGKITEIRKPRWQMVSIHRMRATAITNMLDAGVPEHIVKSFSGHTGDSKAFAKYVKARRDGKSKASETYIKSIAV
jgi:hypothetical protein